jgi:hypothetical protein
VRSLRCRLLNPIKRSVVSTGLLMRYVLRKLRSRLLNPIGPSIRAGSRCARITFDIAKDFIRENPTITKWAEVPADQNAAISNAVDETLHKEKIPTVHAKVFKWRMTQAMVNAANSGENSFIWSTEIRTYSAVHKWRKRAAPLPTCRVTRSCLKDERVTSCTRYTLDIGDEARSLKRL